MTWKHAWNDRTPSRRCEWIDQLRGWAVIVMIEVHCVNVWLRPELMTDWLNYVNGLVAPSFILCAGYSLALSTFRQDGTLRPFAPTAKRLAFILLCAYLLHAPGWSLADWTVLSTSQKYREFFKIDVLQCIVISLLLLQGLVRVIRRPVAYAAVAMALALGAAWVAPYLWAPGVADGLWLPIRGLINGNTDRGVTALFPLFPWFAFAAFGSALGVIYRDMRVCLRADVARWSESQWLAALAAFGAVLAAWGSWQAGNPLWQGTLSASEAIRLHNTTLPSVAQRIGVVCLAGSALGWLQRWRPVFSGPNVVEAAGRESLLLYMLHLNLIFGVLLAEPIRSRLGWEWHSLAWPATLLLTVILVAVNLAAGVLWQRIRDDAPFARRLQLRGVAAAGIWFLVGGWWTYGSLQRSPELAREPYAFLNEARVRKGLPPTHDGLSHDPIEVAREKVRRRRKLSADERRLLDSNRG